MNLLNITKIEIFDYFSSSESFGNHRRVITSLSILLLYLLIVTFVSTRHEVWRDEVRALSVALEPSSFFQLPLVLKNEGHPILWYIILRFGFFITHTTVILKFFSICICFSGVALFFCYAPFPGWQKVLFVSGLPLYEYSVIARNYGISLLLFFLFAIFYEKRQVKPLLLAVILLLLANTNVHSCVLTGILLIMWAIDEVVLRHQQLTFRRISILLCAYAVVLTGIFFAIITTLPTQDTIVTKAFSTSQLVSAVLANIRHPAKTFNMIMFGIPTVIADALLWLLIAGLLIQGHLAAALCVGMILLGTLFTVVYPGALRHQGLFIVFFMTLYWILRNEILVTVERRSYRMASLFHKVSFYILIPTFLLIQIFISSEYIHSDITKEFSSSFIFGKFIDSHPEYHDAIIIGEPDFLIESIPYYNSNLIYIPREGNFRKYVMLTKASRQRMSMGELLDIASTVKNNEHKQVLLVLGHPNMTNRTMRNFGYNKVFIWSSQELSDFKESTFKLAEFNAAITDENYAIYALR